MIYRGSCHCGAITAEYETNAAVSLGTTVAASVRAAA